MKSADKSYVTKKWLLQFLQQPLFLWMYYFFCVFIDLTNVIAMAADIKISANLAKVSVESPVRYAPSTSGRSKYVVSMDKYPVISDYPGIIQINMLDFLIKPSLSI